MLPSEWAAATAVAKLGEEQATYQTIGQPEGELSENGYSEDEERLEVSDILAAHTISSETRDRQIAMDDGAVEYLHRPVLDLDIPVTVLPSSKEGHSHLVIDKLMTFDRLIEFMECLAMFGILEKGYVNVSEARGGAHIRVPWVVKKNADDRRREWGKAVEALVPVVRESKERKGNPWG